jgi:hypothetical protein
MAGRSRATSCRPRATSRLGTPARSVQSGQVVAQDVSPRQCLFDVDGDVCHRRHHGHAPAESAWAATPRVPLRPAPSHFVRAVHLRSSWQHCAVAPCRQAAVTDAWRRVDRHCTLSRAGLALGLRRMNLAAYPAVPAIQVYVTMHARRALTAWACPVGDSSPACHRPSRAHASSPRAPDAASPRAPASAARRRRPAPSALRAAGPSRQRRSR